MNTEGVTKGAALVLFTVLVLGSIVAMNENCEGTLVRGLIWFECIENTK